MDQGSAAAQTTEVAAVGGCEQRVWRTRAQGSERAQAAAGLRAADTQAPGSAGTGGSGQAQGTDAVQGTGGRLTAGTAQGKCDRNGMKMGSPPPPPFL